MPCGTMGSLLANRWSGVGNLSQLAIKHDRHEKFCGLKSLEGMRLCLFQIEPVAALKFNHIRGGLQLDTASETMKCKTTWHLVRRYDGTAADNKTDCFERWCPDDRACSSARKRWSLKRDNFTSTGMFKCQGRLLSA